MNPRVFLPLLAVFIVGCSRAPEFQPVGTWDVPLDALRTNVTLPGGSRYIFVINNNHTVEVYIRTVATGDALTTLHAAWQFRQHQLIMTWPGHAESRRRLVASNEDSIDLVKANGDTEHWTATKLILVDHSTEAASSSPSQAALSPAIPAESTNSEDAVIDNPPTPGSANPSSLMTVSKVPGQSPSVALSPIKPASTVPMPSDSNAQATHSEYNPAPLTASIFPAAPNPSPTSATNALTDTSAQSSPEPSRTTSVFHPPASGNQAMNPSHILTVYAVTTGDDVKDERIWEALSQSTGVEHQAIKEVLEENHGQLSEQAIDQLSKESDKILTSPAQSRPLDH